MIEETRRPNPKSRSERTRRRLRLLNGSKDGQLISPLSISPTKTLVQLENQRNNNLDVDDGPSTSVAGKRKKSRSLSFKWKKSDDDSFSKPAKPKKRRALARFLSFKRKGKLEDFQGGESLRKTLPSTPVIELGEESKLGPDDVRRDDSSDSFKSAASPELLRNRVDEPAVDDRTDGETITERSFTVFSESDFVKELIERGKTLAMSSQRKERARGRGTSAGRKPETTEEPAKVSGDDLRKQLAEGLKAKDAKSQLTEIPQQTSETETMQKSVEEPDKPDSPASTSFAPEPEQLGLPPTENKKEHLYKILVIGELGTGKTSIIKRYVHQFFSQHYRATIGVDFALKVLNWDENSIIRLQLWDIAGQERFGNMTRVYYKEAVGAFIVFDVTRAATFDAVQKWKQDLDSKVQLSDGSPIPCILLANKCDQPKEGVVNNRNKMDEYCKDNGFSGWFETSAKENINIEDAARSLVLKILQNDKLIRTGERGHDSDKIALDGSAESQDGRGCSC